MSENFKTTTIAGYGDVTVNMLEPFDAYLLLGKMAKVILPPLVAMQSGRNEDSALNAMFDAMTPELLTSVQFELLKTTTVVRQDPEGKVEKIDLCTGKAAINRAFRGNLKAMFAVMRFAAEVNFTELFAGSGSVADLIAKLSQ